MRYTNHSLVTEANQFKIFSQNYEWKYEKKYAKVTKIHNASYKQTRNSFDNYERADNNAASKMDL